MRSTKRVKQIPTGKLQQGLFLGFIPCIMVEYEITIYNDYLHTSETYTTFKRACSFQINEILSKAMSYDEVYKNVKEYRGN